MLAYLVKAAHGNKAECTMCLLMSCTKASSKQHRLHLGSNTLADGLQLCSGRRSLHAVQLAVAQVVSRPHQEAAQVILADGPNGVQVC